MRLNNAYLIYRDSWHDFIPTLLTHLQIIFTIDLMKTDSPSPTALTIRNCPLHTDVMITAIHLDERHHFRMLELGLREGTILRVTQRSNFHGRVVARGTERIALDGLTAQSIEVRPVEQENHQ